MEAIMFRSMACCLVMASVLGCAGPQPRSGEGEASSAGAVASPTPPPEGVLYRFDEGSAVSFIASKVTRQHAGGFHTVAGEMVLVDGLPELSRVRAVIDTTSVWTDTDALTSHLEGVGFLEVATYPWASFTSTGVRAEENGQFTITGSFDLHGVAREISFPARIEVTAEVIDVTASLELDRHLWGVSFAGAADDLISDTVRIELELHAFPAATEDKPNT